MAIRFLNSGNISGNLEVNKSANAAVEIAKFKVTGTGGSFGAFSFVSILPGSGNFATQLRLHTNNTGNNFQSINNNAGVLELATNDSNPLVLKTNSTTRLTISNVGAATFTGLVSGITPTAAANFVTKAYADGLAPGAGVFLPLAGGTLTGATATATGISFTVGGHFNANSTTTLGGAVTIEGNLFMDGYNITSIDELSASTGTFSGNVFVGQASLMLQPASGGRIGFNRNTSTGAILNNAYPAFQINGASGTANYLDFQNYNASGGFLGQFVFLDGKMGIGTDSPSATFQVNGNTNFGNAAQPANTSNYINNFNNDLGLLIKKTSSGTGDYLKIENSGGNPKFIVKSNNNVGIGTNSPAARLDVENDDGISSGLHIIADFNRAAGADAQMILGYFANGSSVDGPCVYSANGKPLIFAAGGEKMRIYSDGDITMGDQTNVQAPNNGILKLKTGVTTANTCYPLLYVGGSTHLATRQYGIGFDPEGYQNRMKLFFGVDGMGRGYSLGDFVWNINQVANSTIVTPSDERMRLTKDGYLGIGTTSPNTKLHVVGGTGMTGGWGRSIFLEDTYPAIVWGSNATKYAACAYDHSVDAMRWYTGAATSDATQSANLRMSLKAGNLGIGTDSPLSKLVVSGDVEIITSIIGANKNYATSQGWLPGAAGTFSSQKGYYGGNFSLNGAASENSLIWGENGFGQRALQWQTIGEAQNDADGGWNKGISGLPDGNTHAYMSYVYVKRTSSATTGNFYYGCSTVLNLSGSANSNPYFHVHGIASLPQDVWCIAIGIIQAHTDTNTGTPSIVGVYRVDTGVKILGGTSFKSLSGVQTTQSHRAYHYYSTNPVATLAFANPGFYVIDGTEPNLSTLVNQ